MEKEREDADQLGYSTSWEYIEALPSKEAKSGLTNLSAGDKMKAEKEILTFDQDGSIGKVAGRAIKKKFTSKGIDYRNLNVGYYILVPMIGGILIGILLDNQFKTKPLFIGIFLFLGTIAGFYNLFKLLKE